MTNFLTKGATLWALFILFVLETIGFGLIMAHWDFVIIDEMMDPDHVRQHISEMTELQRQVHAWMTATLDVAYPLTYGPLFAGLALKTFSSKFAIPSIAVIPTDLAEGVVQVMALTGSDQTLWLKALLTPAKLVFFIAAALIAIASIALLIRKRLSNRS